MWKNYERRCTDPWMLLNGGENISPRSWRREDFPEARLLRATSSMKAFRPASWCTVTIFFIVGRREGREHTGSLLQGPNELSKVVTLGPESSQSRTVIFLGRTLTLRQWRIEYEPDQQHCFSRPEGSGTDRRSGCGHSKNR